MMTRPTRLALGTLLLSALALGSQAATVAASADPAGGIEGDLRDDASRNVPAYVYAFDADDLDGDPVASTFGDGYYSLDLDPGTYRICFAPAGNRASAYGYGCWEDPDGTSPDNLVTVAADGTKIVEHVFARGSVLRGQVGDAADPAPAGTTVHFVDTTDELTQYVSEPVAPDGSYAVALPAGEYRMGVAANDVDGDGQLDVAAYKKGAGLTTLSGDATPVTVTPLEIATDVDIDFPAGSRIEGDVVSLLPRSGDGQEGVVKVFRRDAPSTADINVVASQVVDLSAGELALDQFSVSVPPGSYKVALQDARSDEHVWFGTNATRASATVVTVTGDRTERGIDLRLGTSAEPPAQGRPRVSGTTALGSTLAVDTEPAAWPAGTTFRSTWSDGADGAPRTVLARDSQAVVPLLRADVVATVPGWEDITVSTPYAALPCGAATKTGSFCARSVPTVGGTAQVDQVLSTDGGQWAPAPTSLTYQWLRNGVAVPGATAASYRLTAADAGQPVSVVVEAVGAGLRTGRATSASSSPVVAAPVPPAPVLVTGTPRVVGKAKVRRTVTVTGLESSPAASVAVQWLRGGKPIAGATGTTYKVTKADRGRKKGLSVRVTWSAPGSASVTKVSSVVRVK